MTAYYNEFDPYAAQWLRNLIHAGHIAPGIVDERSIEDVIPTDLQGFTQCHFFAGIGVWSLALRRAGWPDSRPVWTGSCPCQPFSAAGAGAGFADPRHLWPSFAWLIKQCKPSELFGEQVASKTVETWIDLVQVDLEAMGYAFGCVPFPSAGVGAPHIRDRAYWVANTNDEGLEGRWESQRQRGAEWPSGARLLVGGVDDTYSKHIQPAGNSARLEDLCGVGKAQRMADSDGRLQPRGEPGRGYEVAPSERPQGSEADPGYSGDRRPGPINGFWGSADWLGCRDEKWRPVEPGTFPLATRAARELGSLQPRLGKFYGRNRNGRLKGYGNAINAEAAKEFIAAYLECQP